MSYQNGPVRPYFISYALLAIVLGRAGFASTKPCVNQVEGAAAVAPTLFESVYPVFDSSLRAKFPRIHRQVLEEYEAAPTLVGFLSCDGSSCEKVRDWMDRVQEASNDLAKRIQKILHRVQKELADVEKDIGRASRKRGSYDALAVLRNKRDDLIALHRVVDMAAKLFRIGPADPSTPFGPGSQAKWERFLTFRGQFGEQLITAQDSRTHWYSDLSQDFRWAWDIVRLSFCVPKLDRALVKSSELGVRPLVIDDLEFDRYLSARFTEENGRSAVGELRSFARPVLYGSDYWAETLDAAEKLKGLGVHLRFGIHFFFFRGIDLPAKQALESMGIAVHGPDPLN